MLTVNKKFAEKYEHGKRRAELANSDLADVADPDESSSSSEDEDGEALTKGLDKQIQRTLTLLRNKDPSIYKPDAVLYRSSEEEEDDSDSDDSSSDDEEEEKKTKKTTIADLTRERIMARIDDDAIPGDYSDSESEEEEQPRGPTYNQEQAAMKKDIRRTMGTMGVSGGDDGGDGGSLYDADDAETDSFFSVKEKTTEEETEHQDLIEEAYAKGMTKAEKTAASKEKAGDGVLDRARAKTFGDGEDGETELTGDDFLHDYVANQGWLETKAKKKRRRGAGAGGDEDLDAVDAAEKFEHAYNFRFEEGNTEITGHSRDIKDVARRPDDRRKRKRAEKAAKKAALREEATSELKRLKNLKRAELEAKLKAVHDVAGLEKPNFDDEEQSMAGFNMDDLDGDFDPASWDAKMSTVFGAEFYDDSDAAAADLKDFDPEEHNPDKQAKDAAGGGDGAAAEEEETEEEAEEEGGGSRKAGKKKSRKAKKKKKSVIDLSELYAMDFEDVIGTKEDSVKTRFSYKQVDKEDYGLSNADIFGMSEKELNKRVSLKKMAPYRTDKRKWVSKSDSHVKR